MAATKFDVWENCEGGLMLKSCLDGFLLFSLFGFDMVLPPALCFILGPEELKRAAAAIMININ